MKRRALLIGGVFGLAYAALPVFGEAQNAGPWGDPLYLQFADEVQARSVLSGALGITLDPNGPIPSLGRFVAIVAPIVEWVTPPTVVNDVVVDPGQKQPGFWVLMRVRTDRDGYAATMAALAPYAQSLAAPGNVFAGE